MLDPHLYPPPGNQCHTGFIVCTDWINVMENASLLDKEDIYILSVEKKDGKL